MEEEYKLEDIDIMQDLLDWHNSILEQVIQDVIFEDLRSRKMEE